jgi:succinate dehydrogenase/fumarate reductase-like Fe-S protein
MCEKQTAVLKLRRGDRTTPAYYDEFTIPFEQGASILDALVWVRSHLDASLAFRYACINANACKQCLIQVDGRVVYACTARLTTGTTTIEPLANKLLIRDLVSDIVPPKERLQICADD